MKVKCWKFIMWAERGGIIQQNCCKTYGNYSQQFPINLFWDCFVLETIAMNNHVYGYIWINGHESSVIIEINFSFLFWDLEEVIK